MSSDPDYIVRPYMHGDEEAIVELLKTSFPDWKDAESPLDHWKWKYIENLHGSIPVVAHWNEKIVGVGHRVFLNIKIDEHISAAYGDDTAIHPDYRRRGIYKKIVGKLEELTIEKKIALKYGIQVHKAAEVMMERIGQELFPFHISHLLHIRDVGLHFRMRPTKNNLLARYGFTLLKNLDSWKNMFKQTKIEPEFKIEDVSLFDERINKFWQNIRNDYNFIIEKNQDYLNWRYCDPRSCKKGRYYVKQAEQDDEILGFIVMEIRSKNDYVEGYIVDLLALSGRMDVARKLLMEASMFFRESDINVVHYRVVKNHPHQVIFNEEGFIEVPSKLHLSLKMFYNKEKIQVIRDAKPSQIHFNFGDYY